MRSETVSPETGRERLSAPSQESSCRVCPVCEYPRARLRYRLGDRFFGVSSESYPLYGCPSCGLLFQDEALVKERLSSFYPEGYWWSEDQGWLSRLEGAYREWVLRRDQLGLLMRYCRTAPRPRLLDIGCGSGTLLELALREGFDAYGLETAPGAVRGVPPSLQERIFLGSEKELIQRGEAFDVLTLFHVLEHVPAPLYYLKSLRKLLRPQGRVLIQVPNVASWQARLLRSRWYGLDCPRHLYNYSPFSLFYLLGRAGYRVLKTRHFSLRDNAPALVSSLWPGLDPISQRVRRLRHKTAPSPWSTALREGVYFALVLAAQPLAAAEALAGRGATITVLASQG